MAFELCSGFGDVTTVHIVLAVKGKAAVGMVRFNAYSACDGKWLQALFMG
ncbi:MAG: DUF6506 family protein [Pedobacter sp.]